MSDPLSHVASWLKPVAASDAPLTAMGERYFQTLPFFVTPETDIGIKVLYDNPREVGADRVINGVAAYSRYGGPCVVVELGTTMHWHIASQLALARLCRSS